MGVAVWSKNFKDIEWSPELNRHYGKGIYPSVAINSRGELVEVHEPRVARNRLYYYAGNLQLGMPLALARIQYLIFSLFSSVQSPGLQSSSILPPPISQLSSMYTYLVSFIAITYIPFHAADSAYPGIVFWGAPIQRTITPQGAALKHPDVGISLVIPKLLTSVEEDIDLFIHPCFSGPFKLPAGYEAVSPAYLIHTSRKVSIERYVRYITLKIHHFSKLTSAKDCEEMAFFSASPIPKYEDSKPVYRFKKIERSKGIFMPNSQAGEIEMKHFCLTVIGCSQNMSSTPPSNGK